MVANDLQTSRPEPVTRSVVLEQVRSALPEELAQAVVERRNRRGNADNRRDQCRLRLAVTLCHPGTAQTAQ